MPVRTLSPVSHETRKPNAVASRLRGLPDRTVEGIEVPVAVSSRTRLLIRSQVRVNERGSDCFFGFFEGGFGFRSFLLCFAAERAQIVELGKNLFFSPASHTAKASTYCWHRSWAKIIPRVSRIARS